MDKVLAEAERGEIEFEYVSEVFHGTRCPLDILQRKGLIFDSEALVALVKKAAAEIGVSFEQWRRSNGSPLSGVTIMEEIEGKRTYRNKIWISAREELAKGYAYDNPETLSDAIHSMLLFKHPRRNSTKFTRYIKETQRRILRTIGKPKVVVIDAEAIGLKATEVDVNLPVSSRIPPSAIKRIEILAED